MKKIGVILAGSGVFDGSEIHEATFSLLAIDQQGGEAVCIAPDVDQHHVINHISGEEMSESRSVLIESARIARGNITPAHQIKMKDLDGLVIPGGFGAAKNLNKWALQGPDGEINKDIKTLIVDCIDQGKPLAAMCMGPTVVAKAFEGTDIHPLLTVGTIDAESPYDIQGISDGMNSIGSQSVMKTVHQIAVDTDHKIVSAPCYMMEASISEIHKNVDELIIKLFDLLEID